MKTFRLFLCMMVVSGTLMAATPTNSRVPVTSWTPPSPKLLQLLEEIFGKVSSQASTLLKSEEFIISKCGACECDPGQECYHKPDGACGCS